METNYVVDSTVKYFENIKMRQGKVIEKEINDLDFGEIENSKLNVICFSCTFDTKDKINNELINILFSKIGESVILYSLGLVVKQISPVVIITRNFIELIEKYIKDHIGRSLNISIDINEMKNYMVAGFTYNDVDFVELRNVDKVIYFIL